MMGVREDEATEGATFAFLAFLFSCFFGCSSSSDSSAFSSSLSSTTSLRFFPLPEVILEEEVETGVESVGWHTGLAWVGEVQPGPVPAKPIPVTLWCPRNTTGTL